MSKYCELKTKAYKCRECAYYAQSEWAKKFWEETAIKLERQAKALALGIAAECI